MSWWGNKRNLIRKTIKMDTRTTLDRIVREHLPHAVMQLHPELIEAMVAELTHEVDTLVLDRAEYIVNRLHPKAKLTEAR